MAENPKPEPDDKEQSKRFIDTARELEADESEVSFDKALNKIVPANKPNERGVVRKDKKA